MADGPAERGNAAVRWAAVSFLAYAVLHHLGTWSAGLGEVGNSGTRWEDWAQLAVPFAVRGSAARLHALASDARWRVREDVAMALRRLGGTPTCRACSRSPPRGRRMRIRSSSGKPSRACASHACSVIVREYRRKARLIRVLPGADGP